MSVVRVLSLDGCPFSPAGCTSKFSKLSFFGPSCSGCCEPHRSIVKPGCAPVGTTADVDGLGTLCLSPRCCHLFDVSVISPHRLPLDWLVGCRERERCTDVVVGKPFVSGCLCCLRWAPAVVSFPRRRDTCT